MPNINLRDNRNRDALVRAEFIKQSDTVRYVDAAGDTARLRKVLKGSLELDYETLLATCDGEPEQLAAALVADDPEVDLERIGTFLNRPSRVWVNEANDIVYRIVETEIVHSPDGTEKERRQRKLIDPNIESEFPISWTGAKIKKADAIRRFVFSSKLQIVHANGLTYDFLYAMAKELSEADSLMLLGAGKTGKEPLVFRRGGALYRAFLEGRVDGPRYVLLMHLSNLELKAPEPVVEIVDVQAADAAAATETATPAEKPKRERKAPKVILKSNEDAPAEVPAAKKAAAKKRAAEPKVVLTGKADAKPKKRAATKSRAKDKAPTTPEVVLTKEAESTKPARKRAAKTTKTARTKKTAAATRPKSPDNRADT